MKSELKRQCAQDPVAMAYEIERLNAQVAMLNSAIERASESLWVSDDEWNDVHMDNTNAVEAAAKATNASVIAWLATHDAKVRDDALEEAAKLVDSLYDECEPWMSGEDVRAMKGTK